MKKLTQLVMVVALMATQAQAHDTTVVIISTVDTVECYGGSLAATVDSLLPHGKMKRFSAICYGNSFTFYVETERHDTLPLIHVHASAPIVTPKERGWELNYADTLNHGAFLEIREHYHNMLTELLK